MKKLASHGLLARMVLVSLFGSTGERGANIRFDPVLPDQAKRRSKKPVNQRFNRISGRILSAH